MKAIFYWEENETGAVRLLRIFGSTPEVCVPETIEGRPVTEIGAYCFGQKSHLPEHYRITEVDETGSRERELTQPAGATQLSELTQDVLIAQLRELAGDYPVRICLPDTITRIGNFAFYNCTSLEQLELGSRMEELGSDAFMNCHKLHFMTIRTGAKEKSGARQILAQISADMEVTFLGKQGVEAVVFFPEYYESYDEIAPAHIFGRNIEGEGFRARQCFLDGCYEFDQYDTIFPKACVEERELTLCRMAMNRLHYPVELNGEAGARYEAYVKAHLEQIASRAVAERRLEEIWFLCDRKIMEPSVMESCIRYATELDWAKGAAELLDKKNVYFPKKSVAQRYSFDDF